MKQFSVSLFVIPFVLFLCLCAVAAFPGLAAASECTATLSNDLVVHVPVIQYSTAAGDLFLSADFRYVPDSSDILFMVTNAGFMQDPGLSCGRASVVDNLTVYIPDLDISGSHFWLVLAFDTSRASTGFYFKLVNFGLSDNSSTVGTAGGVISSGDLTVTIPSGGFSSSVPITVANETALTPGDASAISGSYSITGIPADFGLPIAFQLKPLGALSGTSYLEVDNEFFDEYWRPVAGQMLFLPVTESGGYLRATLPPFSSLSAPQNAGRESQASNWLLRWAKSKLKAVSSKRTINCSNDNFTITMDSSFVMRKCVTEDVCDLLDSARKQYADVIRMKGGSFPLAVYVIGDALTPPSGNSAEYSNICGSESLSVSGLDASECSTDLKENIGHELMHKFTTQYDPRTCLGVGAGISSPLWFEEAVTTWAEQTLLTSAYVPINFISNKAESLKLYPASTDKTTAQRHGYGLAPFVKYAADRYGSARILDLYSPIENSALSVEQRVITGISSMGVAGSVWTDYVKSYLGGQVYGMPAGHFLDGTMLTETKEIREDSQPWTSTKGYQDLQAKLYRIKFTGPFTDPDKELTISISDTAGDATMLVYEIPGDTGGNLVFRDEVTDQIVLTPGAVASQPELLIAVINETALGNTGTNNTITLEIKWTGGDGAFSYSASNTNVTLSPYVKGSINVAVDPNDSGTYVEPLYAPDEEGVTLKCPKPSGGLSHTYTVCGSASITSIDSGNIIMCWNPEITGFKWELGETGSFTNDSCMDVTVTSSDFDVTVWLYDIIRETYVVSSQCAQPNQPYEPLVYDYTLYKVRLKCAY
ncbi:MAG: hypothetical protein HZA17_11740 [Nitrospirae bacterium]|nr:hypothetical protein [Nitrospirota bacterium]